MVRKSNFIWNLIIKAHTKQPCIFGAWLFCANKLLSIRTITHVGVCNLSNGRISCGENCAFLRVFSLKTVHLSIKRLHLSGAISLATDCRPYGKYVNIYHIN